MTVVSWQQNGLPSVVNRFGGNYATAWKLSRGSTAVALGLITGRVRRYMGIQALIAEFYRSLREGSPAPVPVSSAVLNASLLEQIKDRSRPVAKERVTPRHRPRATHVAPRVLVTGGSGFLGGRLVEQLAKDGVAVRATTRLLSRARRLPHVEWIQCDLTEREDLRRAVDGVETIFHCAGMVGPPGSLAEYRRVNVDATLNLAEAAEEAGVERLIHVSSLSVYGPPLRGARLVDENSPYDDRAADRGVYTQTKLQAEKALLEYVRQRERPRVVVLRPGTIYGPGAPPPLGLFQLPSPKNRPAVTGGWRTPIALSFIDNVIDAMLAAAESDAPTGSVYNVVDSDDISQADVCREVRRLTAERIRPVRIPYPVVKRTLAPMRYSCAAAHRELEWQPRVTLAEGLSRVLADATPLPSQTTASMGMSDPKEAQA
jgi:nucleoside-diphosphate-sugar epimerase